MIRVCSQCHQPRMWWASSSMRPAGKASSIRWRRREPRPPTKSSSRSSVSHEGVSAQVRCLAPRPPHYRPDRERCAEPAFLSTGAGPAAGEADRQLRRSRHVAPLLRRPLRPSRHTAHVLRLPGAATGAPGTGQAVEIGFAIGRASLAHWVGRLTEHRVDFEGPFDRLEERVLHFSDPEGLQLELVTSAGSSSAEDARGGAIDHAIRGLHGVTLWE